MVGAVWLVEVFGFVGVVGPPPFRLDLTHCSLLFLAKIGLSFPPDGYGAPPKVVSRLI